MRADDLRRRQRSKHLVIAVLLVVMSATFFMLTIVRMGQQAPQFAGGSLSTSLGRPLGTDVTLVDHDGRPVRLADFAGKVRMVFFGFTHCPDVCPTGLSTISLLLEEVGEAARDVRALFITVDPERDTPEVMKQYISSFPKGVIGLTGSPQQIAGAGAAFHAYVKKVPQRDGAYTLDHTASILLLDRAGNFRGTIDIHENPFSAAEKLRRLLQQPTQSTAGKRP